MSEIEYIVCKQCTRPAWIHPDKIQEHMFKQHGEKNGYIAVNIPGEPPTIAKLEESVTRHTAVKPGRKRTKNAPKSNTARNTSGGKGTTKPRETNSGFVW